MYTLGHTFMPPGIHAGGLRDHGMAPLICELHARGHIEAQAYPQTAVFESAMQFARTEGIIPAPESAHAICAAIGSGAADAASQDRVVLFNLSGHGC
jgi:tryptophan synthase beta chain